MTTEAFLAAPRLALDTEFVWTKTYWARLGLVQAAGSDGFDRTRLHTTPPAAIPLPRDAPPDLARAVLLDPMAASSVPLGSVLRDPSTAKILHDAHQDLVHLARWTGEKPVSVFDTKIAAGFCGFAMLAYPDANLGGGGRNVMLMGIYAVLVLLATFVLAFLGGAVREWASIGFCPTVVCLALGAFLGLRRRKRRDWKG